MGVVMLEMIDLWQSDFGVIRVPTEMKLALSNAKRRKDGEIDYRYRSGREMRDRLNAIARKEHLDG